MTFEEGERAVYNYKQTNKHTRFPQYVGKECVVDRVLPSGNVEITFDDGVDFNTHPDNLDPVTGEML